MTKKSGSLDDWRDYFRTANSNIFEIIEHAIMVAASDCPTELRLRRDRIAERLFSLGSQRCAGCDRGAELSPPSDGADLGARGGDGGAGASKESNVNSSSRDDNETAMNLGVHVSSFSYGEAEALTDEIEEESMVVDEVFRIKKILHNSEEESDSVLFESLRRLQLMGLSVDTLKATEIGKEVIRFRKHGSHEIRNLAKTLIDVWKDMVDEWVNASETAGANCTEGTPDSVNPSVVDEYEGLPSPPMDELAFFTAPAGSMELSRIFDGMDDDGNPRNSGEFSKNRQNGRKPSAESQNVAKRKQSSPAEASVVSKENKNQQVRKQEGTVKPSNRPSSNAYSGPGRPPRISTEQKVNNETRLQQKFDRASIQKRPVSRPQDKLKNSEEDEVQKLEATKRKLQERYQQAENAKKQRTIQVMELHDLPKQGLGHRNPHVKPGNHNRHWAHGRR